MRMVFLDVETTGFSPGNGDRVIEIGAVATGGLWREEFSELIGVDCTIHPGAEAVHGITPFMLKGKPGPEEVWPRFLRFVEDAPLVAHNASFDLGFIRSELGRLGQRLDNLVYDSLPEAQRRLPNLPNHRLETVAKHLLGGVPADCRLHRALGDARLLAKVWEKMGCV